MTSIGTFLTSQCRLRDLSLRELGNMSGISHSHIALLKADQANPTIETLEKLAKGLDMPLEQLLIGCGYLPGDEPESLNPTGTDPL